MLIEVGNKFKTLTFCFCSIGKKGRIKTVGQMSVWDDYNNKKSVHVGPTAVRVSAF